MSKKKQVFGIDFVFKDKIAGLTIANFETEETAFLGASDIVNLVANLGKTLSLREARLSDNVEGYKAVGEKKASLSKTGTLVVSEAAQGKRLLAASDAVTRFSVSVGIGGLDAVASALELHLDTSEAVKLLRFRGNVKKAILNDFEL